MFHSLILWLLVSADFVFYSSCEKSASNKGVYATKGKSNGAERWQREILSFRRGLKVRNDKGELVEVTTDDSPPPGSGRRALSKSVLFHLYTRLNPTDYDELTINSSLSKSDLRASNFNRRRPTYFITHGWLNSGNSPSCDIIKNAYLKRVNANVIIVDWGAIALASYGWAVKHVDYVGKRVAGMIKFLISTARMDPAQVTLIGHSLGAHVMGIAGFRTDGIVGTLFGLDPAFPMFSVAGPGDRISNFDAKYVQIIHTNAGFLGYEQAIGTADFFPDGGSRQTSCKVDLGGSCSHGRAYEFFAESLKPSNKFYARPCESQMHFVNGECKGPNVVKMGGLKINRTARGSFYLWTNQVAPYAAGIGA